MNTKSLHRQLAAAVAMLLVATIALGSSTFAWFVNNNKVQASLANVQVATAGSNLLIKKGYTAASKQESGTTIASTSTDSAAKLSPVSTGAVISSWYDADTWTTGNANAAGKQLANKYRALTLTNATPAVNGNPTIATFTGSDGTTRNAYLAAEYTIYATGTAADVYLAPESGLAVTTDDTAAAFKDAMRVGIVIDDTLVLVYAPTAETAADAAAGNDNSLVDTTGKTTAGYHYVTATDTVTTDSTAKWVNDLSSYTAAVNTNGGYTAGTNKIAAAVGEAGKKVDIYVWLEGTDYQCTTALAGTDSSTYSVTANFVGVAAAT